jgi:hypothetical protein
MNSLRQRGASTYSHLAASWDIVPVPSPERDREFRQRKTLDVKVHTLS